MNIIVIFACFALFAALGALWFTAEAVRRIDARGEAMVRPYIGNVKRDVEEALKGMRALARRLDGIEHDLKWLKARGADVSGHQAQVAAAHGAMAQLERFQPTISLNG